VDFCLDLLEAAILLFPPTCSKDMLSARHLFDLVLKRKHLKLPPNRRRVSKTYNQIENLPAPTQTRCMKLKLPATKIPRSWAGTPGRTVVSTKSSLQENAYFYCIKYDNLLFLKITAL
jgi:hypothetical protein